MKNRDEVLKTLITIGFMALMILLILSKFINIPSTIIYGMFGVQAVLIICLAISTIVMFFRMVLKKHTKE